MKKKIKKIIKNVKAIYANDKRINEILAERPIISLEGDGDGDFELKHIVFGTGPQVHITTEKIIFVTEKEKIVLLEHKGFKNLLKM